MRFKDVFSIIGPAMIGPSSSHTAGAVRLGRIGRSMLGYTPSSAEIHFYGSFAETYRGHGTDIAIIGGLMNFSTDDALLPQSPVIARQIGMDVTFHTGSGAALHPNTVKMILKGGNREISVTGCSIGGGNVQITRINQFDIRFTGMCPALVVFHLDRPGLIADITRILSDAGINISHMDVDRLSRNGAALTVLELDSPAGDDIAAKIALISGVTELTFIDLAEGGA
jgi:L-serine dehydratase